MSNFTAAELVEFYQQVADGGEIEVNDRDGTWKEAFGNDSPCLFSNTLTWRIKPTKLERLEKNVVDAKAAADAAAADAYDVSYAAYTRWDATREALCNYLKEQHK